MFNPQMMGMGNLPKVPPVRELWKDEKSKYRHWIILFALGVMAVLSLYVTSFIMNVVDRTNIIKILQQQAIDNGLTDSAAYNAALSYYNNYILAIPVLIIVSMTIGLVYYIVTVIKSYQEKTFAHLSQWATIIVGIAAFLSAFQLFSLLWRGPGATFEIPGGIFEFINYFIILLVYMFVSRNIVKIRRTFLISEQVEKIKKDPQYQAMVKQMQQMQNGSINTNNTTSGPFGPASTKASQVPNEETKTKSKEEIELEAMSDKELQEVATKLSISGAVKMSRKELIKAILRVTNSK